MQSASLGILRLLASMHGLSPVKARCPGGIIDVESARRDLRWLLRLEDALSLEIFTLIFILDFGLYSHETG